MIATNNGQWTSDPYMQVSRGSGAITFAPLYDMFYKQNYNINFTFKHAVYISALSHKITDSQVDVGNLHSIQSTYAMLV